MFFSKSNLSFYTPEVHGNSMPLDAVEIPDALYFEILHGHATMGKEIAADENGFPVLTEPKPLPLPLAMARRASYPPIEDYLDAVVKGDQAQIDAYVAACLAVKAKYPKS
jgi:hypothetical protein